MTTPNDRLRQARESRGWSQKYVADALDTNRFTVARWELGMAVPRPFFRMRLCELFQSTPDMLGFGATNTEEGEKSASEESAVAPAFIPTPPMLLIGRQTLLQQMRERLLPGTSLAMQGLPGAGKTSLAATLAHDPAVAAQFPDGVLWANLGQSPDIASLLGGLTQRLQLTLKARTIPQMYQQLRATTQELRLLVIIDDAWQIEHALAFTIGGPRCAHLLITRLPAVASRFGVADALLVPELSVEESITLLAQLAPHVVAQEPDHIRALAEGIGGLPLAVSLVGHYLRVQSQSSQPRRIHAAVAYLQDAQARLHLAEPIMPMAALPEHDVKTTWSLAAAIDMSARTISLNAHALLHILSLFPVKPNSFDEEAALAVSGLHLPDLVAALDELYDAGLIESMGMNRYALHQSIAEYGRQIAIPVDAAERMANYFLDFLQKYGAEHARVEIEFVNIQCALSHARSNGWDMVFIQMVLALAQYLLARGVYGVADNLFTEAYQRLSVPDDATLRAPLVQHMWQLAHGFGDVVAMRHYATEAYDLARSQGNAADLCTALRLLGNIELNYGDQVQAEALLQESFALAWTFAIDDNLVPLFTMFGILCDRAGEYRQAEQYYQDGMQIARAHVDLLGMLMFLSNIAILQGRRGLQHESEATFLEALAIARSLAHRESICRIEFNLGIIATELGAYDRAEAYLEECILLARALGSSLRLSNALSQMCTLMIQRNDFPTAKRYHEESLGLARALKHHDRICTQLHDAVLIALHEKRYDDAIALMQERRALLDEIGDRWQETELLIDRGEVELCRADFVTARESFQAALDQAQDIGFQPLAALAFFGLARLAHIGGELAVAKEYGRTSLDILVACDHWQAAIVRDWFATLPQNVSE